MCGGCYRHVGVAAVPPQRRLLAEVVLELVLERVGASCEDAGPRQALPVRWGALANTCTASLHRRAAGEVSAVLCWAAS